MQFCWLSDMMTVIHIVTAGLQRFKSLKMIVMLGYCYCYCEREYYFFVELLPLASPKIVVNNRQSF
jgi:hypothetical protein